MKIGSTRALVLNQDYSPVTVCSIPKAFLLLYLQKAELIEKMKLVSLELLIVPFLFHLLSD